MSSRLPPLATTLFRAGLVLAAALPAATLLVLWLLTWSPLGTGQADAVAQPIEFDHRHHAGDDGIDCRYCHQTAETAATAGLPSIETCLNCHGQIWNRSALLAPIRRAGFEGTTFAWRKVHRLPAYVYFDHSIHVAKGVGCATCHGRVDRMAAVQQVAPLTMGWCLACHRDPGPHLRPPGEIASMTWEPPAGAAGAALARELTRAYDVAPRTSCTTCHR